MDLKVILKDKERLCLLSCGVLVLIIVTFFLSSDFAMFLYGYSSSIVLGNSEGKVITILAWLLASFFIGWLSLKRDWKSFDFKLIFSCFLALIVLLSIVNIAAFNSMLSNINAQSLPGNLALSTITPEMNIYSGFSRLGHTHSLKPVLYRLFKPITDIGSLSFSMGESLNKFFADWALYPTVFLTLAYLGVSIILITYTTKKLDGFYALFVLFILSIASVSFFITIFDAGPLSSGGGIAFSLVPLYLILYYLKRRDLGFEIKWIIILAPLPLVLSATFDLLRHFLVGSYVMSFEVHLLLSTMGLASALVYALSHQFKRRNKLLAILTLLLIANLLTFKPYGAVEESIQGDKVYLRSFYPPVMGQQLSYEDQKSYIIDKLEKIPEISNPKPVIDYKKVFLIRGDVEESGLTSAQLAEEIVGKRVTPLTANFFITFANLDNKKISTTYLPSEQINGKQLPIFLGPLTMRSQEKINENYIKVTFLSPKTFVSTDQALFFYGHANVTYMFSPLSHKEKTGKSLAKDFLFQLIPVTSAQIKAREIAG